MQFDRDITCAAFVCSGSVNIPFPTEWFLIGMKIVLFASPLLLLAVQIIVKLVLLELKGKLFKDRIIVRLFACSFAHPTTRSVGLHCQETVWIMGNASTSHRIAISSTNPTEKLAPDGEIETLGAKLTRNGPSVQMENGGLPKVKFKFFS